MRSVKASAAHLWGECQGFAVLDGLRTRHKPEGPRLEGIAAHEFLEAKMHGFEEDPHATHEMRAGARQVIDVVEGIDAGFEYSEQPVPLDLGDGRSIGIKPDWFGEKRGIPIPELHVLEYKFGHKSVSADRNPQVMLGARGAAAWLGYAYQVVHLWVVQPRDYTGAGSVKHYVMGFRELEAYTDHLMDVARSALSGNPEFTPGAACASCGGAAGCVALAQKTEEILVDIKNGAYAELTPDELSIVLHTAQLSKGILDARVDALKEQGVDYVNAGTIVPNYYMEPGRSSRSWVTPVSVGVLEVLSGHTLHHPAEPFTPAQAENAGVPKKLVQANAVSTPGKRSLKFVSAEDMQNRIDKEMQKLEKDTPS